MAGKSKDSELVQKEDEKKSIEEAFQELEEIIGKLSDKDVSLADSFNLYSEGMKLVKSCSEELDDVEKKVLELSDDGTVEEFE